MNPTVKEHQTDTTMEFWGAVVRESLLSLPVLMGQRRLTCSAIRETRAKGGGEAGARVLRVRVQVQVGFTGVVRGGVRDRSEVRVRHTMARAEGCWLAEGAQGAEVGARLKQGARELQLTVVEAVAQLLGIKCGQGSW